MTPFGKLFAATAIVATGFGVAVLLGEPAVVTQALRTSSKSTQPPIATAAQVESPVAGSWISSSVQLLPDRGAENKLATGPESPVIETPIVPMVPAPVSRSGIQPAESVANVDNAPWMNYGRLAPQAKLRNEAPRPIGIEPRSSATIRRVSPIASDNRTPLSGADPYAVTPAWSAPQLLPAGYTSEDRPTAATNASYDEPFRPAVSACETAPPPWPATEESDGQRTHIIIDGDSLEKLAGRYLGDPRRSSEIYELNRDVISSPDLLPIDAELKIPQRSTRALLDRQGRRIAPASESTMREAAYGNLVPVRPASPYDVVPRAQLTRPLPVE